MTDDDRPLGPYADELAELDRATQRVRRAEKTLADAKRDAKPQTVRAMRAGIIEGHLGVRSEVQRHSPFSAPTVRSLADDAGIPPDERYVRGSKATEEHAVPSNPSERQTDIDMLSLATVQRLAALGEAGAEADGAPSGWAKQVTAGAPAKRHPYLIVKAALAAGYLAESQIPH